MFENVVVGELIVSPEELFSENKNDWETVEKPKTLFTNERNLAKVMKEAGIVSSISEVRRNQPQLFKTLDELDFFKVKWGKKFLFIAVGN